jgi:hypothetical protein
MVFLLDGKSLETFGTRIFFLRFLKSKGLYGFFYGFLFVFNEAVTCTFSVLPLSLYKSTVYCIRGYPRACKQIFTMIKKEKILKQNFLNSAIY